MISDYMRKSYSESKRIIRKAMKDNQLVLFVGAGASVSAGMPTWSRAVKTIAGHLGIDSENAPPDNLRIPQYYYNARGKKEYTQLMREIFCHGARLQKQPVHDRIIEFNTRTIITTNYDHLIEMAAEDNSEVIQVVSKDSDLPYRKSGKELIKMHGDFENDNFVLKEDDYLEYSVNFRLIENYVKSIIGTKVILFLGYSFNDPDVKQIFSWVKGILGGDFQRAYLIESSRPYDTNETEYYRNFGINILYASLQLGEKFNGEDISKNLLDMLDWLLKDDEPAVLDKIIDGLSPFADMNYAGEKYLGRAFYAAGLEVSNGILREIPGLTDSEGGKILRAIVHERCTELISGNDKDKGKFESIRGLSDNCKADDPNELDKIRFILAVLKKSGVRKIIFYEPLSVSLASDSDDPEVPAGECDIPEWFEAVRLFDYERLRAIAYTNNAHLSETTPDLYVEQGYINYVLGEYLLSYNCFRNAARIYYRKRKFARFFLSEVSRFCVGKMIVQRRGAFPIAVDRSDVNSIETEINALNLERVFDSLPDLGADNSVFRDIYTFNIAYNLFSEAYFASEKIREQANARYFIFSGEAAFSGLRYKLYDYFNFLTLNCLPVDRYSEFITIFKIYFQSILSSVMTFDPDGKNIHADKLCVFDIMTALRYETCGDLKKLLRNTNIIIPLDDNALDYFADVMSRCPKNDTENSSLIDGIFWKGIVILGFCGLSQRLADVVLHELSGDTVNEIDCRLQADVIIKFFVNADRQGFINDSNITEAEKFLQRVLNHIVKDKSDVIHNLALEILSLCKKYGRAFDDDAVISRLLSRQTRE